MPATEVMFYHLERRTLDEALPRLLQATLQKGWRAVVQPASQERVTALDAYLWTWKEDGFLPHGAQGDAQLADFTAEQPIYLTTQETNPNAAEVLFLVDGAKRTDLAHFTRCVVIFNGRDAEDLAEARQYWVQLKNADYDLTYWQETADGKWQKKE